PGTCSKPNKAIACGTQATICFRGFGSTRVVFTSVSWTTARVPLRNGMREPVCRRETGIRVLACESIAGAAGAVSSPSRSARPYGGEGQEDRQTSGRTKNRGDDARPIAAVMPAKAGIQYAAAPAIVSDALEYWIPTFAGMTPEYDVTLFDN